MDDEGDEAQLRTYFANWRRFVERVGEELPYDEADEQAIRYRYLEDEVVSQTWFEPIPEVKVMWGRSGHLAGSVWFGLEVEAKRIFIPVTTRPNRCFYRRIVQRRCSRRQA